MKFPFIQYQFKNQTRVVFYILLAVCHVSFVACHNTGNIPVQSEQVSHVSSVGKQALQEKKILPKALLPSNQLVDSGNNQFSDAKVPIPSLSGITDIPWDMLQARLDQEPDLACKISYQQTAAAMPTTTPANNAKGFPPLTMVLPEIFMAGCLKLPRTVQKCQVFRYTIRYHAMCKNVRRKFYSETET